MAPLFFFMEEFEFHIRHSMLTVIDKELKHG